MQQGFTDEPDHPLGNDILGGETDTEQVIAQINTNFATKGT